MLAFSTETRREGTGTGYAQRGGGSTAAHTAVVSTSFVR
jgi:hypothetical protein